MMDTFLLKLDQHVTHLFRWEIWKFISFFEIRSRSRFSWPLHFCCSIVEFAFLLTMEMHLNLKKNQKSNCEKSKFILKKNKQDLRSLLLTKKNTNSYIRVFTTFITLNNACPYRPKSFHKCMNALPGKNRDSMNIKAFDVSSGPILRSLSFKNRTQK